MKLSGKRIFTKTLSIVSLICLVIFCMDAVWSNVLKGQFVDSPVLSSMILWFVVCTYFFLDQGDAGGLTKLQRIVCFALVGLPMLIAYTFMQETLGLWPKHVLAGLIVAMSLTDSYFWRNRQLNKPA